MPLRAQSYARLRKGRSRPAVWRELGWAGVILGLAVLFALFAPRPVDQTADPAGAALPAVSTASR
jgi:hypothetical protein